MTNTRFVWPTFRLPSRPTATCVVLLSLAATAPAAAQQIRKLPSGAAPDSGVPVRRLVGVVEGVVTDVNHRPVVGAEVSILSTTSRQLTGTNGTFRIRDASPGSHILLVRRIGLRPASAVIKVVPPDTVRLTFALEKSTYSLDTVVIAAKRRGIRMKEFEDRRKLGFGEFMTEEEINANNAVFATELMRRFKGIDVSPSYDAGAIAEWYALSKRGGGSAAKAGGVDDCVIQVYLDGVPLPAPFNLDNLPSPRELGGIEVYNGAATAPVQFGGVNRRCGMILVWTKEGY